MVTTFAPRWWAIALRGVFAVLFGISAFVWPGLTLAVLVLLFGTYALLDGIFTIAGAVVQARNRMTWWPSLLEGIAGIVLGVLTILWPGITGLVLLYFIAAWAIITGVLEIAAAFRLRKLIQGELFLGLSGLASIIFGLLMLFFPGAGALAVAWIIGTYALIFGVLLIILGFRLRGKQGEISIQTA